MKTIIIGLITCAASCISASIHAEQTTFAESLNDTTPALMAAAAKLPRATNDEVIIGGTTGQIVAFDSKGYILKSNADYLPRVPLTNVTDADFQVLLESKLVYDSLTIFGLNSPRTVGSAYFEERLRDIWLKGSSLAQKIQTRMVLLEMMRGYNDSVADYAARVGFADNANSIEKNASDAEQNASVAVSNATQQLESADSRKQFHEARRDLRQASADLDNQTVTANGAASLSTAMQQQADTYRKICAQFANQLSQYNIQVTGKPPFRAIPPLSMRSEVDMDRVGKIAPTQAVSSSN